MTLAQGMASFSLCWGFARHTVSVSAPLLCHVASEPAPGPPRGMGVALCLGPDCWPWSSQSFWCHQIFSWEIFLQFLMALPSWVILGRIHRALYAYFGKVSVPVLPCWPLYQPWSPCARALGSATCGSAFVREEMGLRDFPHLLLPGLVRWNFQRG